MVPVLGLPGHALFLCSLLGKHTHTRRHTHTLLSLYTPYRNFHQR
jgi:hypothetical protein